MSRIGHCLAVMAMGISGPVAVVMLAGKAGLAQDVAEFKDGYLTFTNINPELYYRVEFKPNLTEMEEWDGDYRGLVNIRTNAMALKVPVGVFYRVVGSEQPAPSALVAKCGQTTSYRTGDDGMYQKGVTWPVVRFTDHGDGRVTDNLTGLMWAKNANLPGGKRTWDGAIDYCNGLNAGVGTYGHNDWRLPNVRELQSLIDHGRASPALPSGHFFANVQSGSYWSSTTYAPATGYALCVDLYDGIVRRDIKNSGSVTYSVWPVRGGQ